MPLPFQIDVEAIGQLDQESQERVRRELVLLEQGVADNPLWGYIPHEKQAVYHGLDAPTAAFVGGNQSGKTYGGTADDLIQLCDRDALPPWLQQFKRWDEFYAWVVVPALVPHMETVALPLFRQLTPKKQLWKGSWEKAWDQKLRRIQFANGNRVDFLSREMDLDRFSGATLHRVRFDEEPPGNKGKNIHTECTIRVLRYQGEIRFTMTPLLGLSWSYHLLTTKNGRQSGQPRWDDEVKVVTVDMDDNPYLAEKAKARRLKGLSESERQARKSGRWVHFAGLIYPQFDPDSHVIPQGEIPKGAPIYFGTDPGVDHPTAVVWAFVNAEDRMEVFDSFKAAGETVEGIAKEVKRREEKWGIKPVRRVIDPSARNRQQATGRSVQAEFSAHGLYCIPGQNSRLFGFNRVRERLETDRLLIWAGNEELVEEFLEYRWKPAPHGDSVGKEEPIKVNDDLLDALRYICASSTFGPTPEPDDDEPTEPRRKLFADHFKRLVKGKPEHPTGAIFQ